MRELNQFLIPIALFMIILVCLYIIIHRVRLFLLSRKRDNNYKTGMITIINEKTEDNEADFKRINELYAEYCSSARKGELTLDVFTLNAQLIHELRNQSYQRYYKKDLPENGKIANEVEQINNHLHERLRNDDETLLKILGKIDELSVDDHARISLETIKGELLSYVNAIVATCDGRLIEKELAFARIQLKLNKAKRLRMITFLVGAIGILSGLITIFTNIRLK